MTREFSEVLNIVNVEQRLLMLHLCPHVLTLRFTYADDDDDHQTGAVGLFGLINPKKPEISNSVFD